MCNRIRGERYRGTRLVTLPYFNLPYLKLSKQYSLIYYITLHEPIFDCQSVAKTHKTLIFLAKQALTRRGHCPAGALLGSKIGSVATPGVHQNVAGNAFEHQIGQKCNPMRSQAPENIFIALLVLKHTKP